ncbi:MAG: lamin tail domain-containing protein, partial [Bacteroidota bacterium]|nr:lamin tail domain-containing protein [Bacteroidota bacterium]
DLDGKQLTGYVVGVNLSGTTDKLTLWKMEKGHIVSALINANFDWNASDTVALEVTRSSQGLWALKYNMSGDFQKLLTAGSMSDTSFKSNGYCGLLYTFTPSRAGQLWADDFYAGLPVLDTIPPKLIELKVLNNTTLQLRFSEYISNQSAVNTGNYLINGSIQPAVVKQDTADASLILLCFEKPFEKNLAHTLNISHLSDQNGNIIKDPANQMFSYCPFEALEARPLSENHLVVCFSQVPDTKNVLLKSCYLLKETGNTPDSVWIDKEIPARIHLKFNVGFIHKNQYSLYVHGLYNSNKDTLEPAVLTFFWYKPQPFDVVINEIMADPEPSAGLPQAEYMELYNRTKYSINLSGWAMNIGAQSISFRDVAIAANGYLILCRDTSVFNQY